MRICSQFAAQPWRAFWRTAHSRPATRAQPSRIRSDLSRSPVHLHHTSTRQNSVIHAPPISRGPFSSLDTLQGWEIDTNSLSFLLCGLPRAAITISSLYFADCCSPNLDERAHRRLGATRRILTFRGDRRQFQTLQTQPHYTRKPFQLCGDHGSIRVLHRRTAEQTKAANLDSPTWTSTTVASESVSRNRSGQRRPGSAGHVCTFVKSAIPPIRFCRATPAIPIRLHRVRLPPPSIPDSTSRLARGPRPSRPPPTQRLAVFPS
jgi:hypothetical protein